MRVLITGASSGIGYSMAKYFSSLGYDLILVARDKKKLDKIKRELDSKVEVVSLDLRNIDNCYELYNKFKDIDILVNNAGFGLFGEFIDTDLDKEIDMIDLNIKALHVLCKFVYESQKRKGNAGSHITFLKSKLQIKKNIFCYI